MVYVPLHFSGNVCLSHAFITQIQLVEKVYIDAVHETAKYEVTKKTRHCDIQTFFARLCLYALGVREACYSYALYQHRLRPLRKRTFDLAKSMLFRSETHVHIQKSLLIQIVTGADPSISLSRKI